MISPFIDQFLRRGDTITPAETRLMIGSFARLRSAVVGTTRQVSANGGQTVLLAQNDSPRVLAVTVLGTVGSADAALASTSDARPDSTAFRQPISNAGGGLSLLKPGGSLWATPALGSFFSVTEVSP